MKHPLIKALTIILFLSLIGAFVAVKAGFFETKESSLLEHFHEESDPSDTRSSQSDSQEEKQDSMVLLDESMSSSKYISVFPAQKLLSPPELKFIIPSSKVGILSPPPLPIDWSKSPAQTHKQK